MAGRRRYTRRSVVAGAIGLLGGLAAGLGVQAGSVTPLADWHDLAALADATGEYALDGDLTPERAGYEQLVDPDGDGWTPVEDFSGSLDGAGHAIVGLVVDGGDEAGLFGDVAPTTIESLVLVDTDVSGGDDVGALVGLLRAGTIERVGVAGAVSGVDYVGGLVGDNRGSVIDAYAHASVKGATAVGGLVGYNGGEVRRSLATGAVAADSDGGGLVGWHRSSDLADAYWDRGTTGQAEAIGDDGGTSAGLEGYGAVSADEPADELVGASPADDDTTPALDLDGTWTTVEAETSLSVTPAADGYPILETVDVKWQLDAQGISVADGAAIVVDAGGEVTISNVTIGDG